VNKMYSNITDFLCFCFLALFIYSFIHLFIFGSTGFWTRGFMLARQALYFLSHVSSPLCSDYFGDRVLFLAKACLDHNPPIFGFHHGWDDRFTPPVPPFFSWDVISWNFWPGLVWNLELPNLSLLCSLEW
jgi:hypothetical protein